MKKLFASFIFLFAVLVSCQKQDQPQVDTQFQVLITQQPIGGLNISTVSTTYVGTITGTVEPVNVKVEWMVENATHENAFAINTQTVSFVEGKSVTKATACLVLDPYRYSVYYWVRLSWTDDKGNHTIESNKAFCEKKPI